MAWDFGVDEITSTGSFVRTVVSSTGPDFVNIWGIEYNPATDKLFVTQLGAGSMYSILRVNASTGDIETGTYLRYASDLFLTASGNLVVGSWTETAQIYNQDLILWDPSGPNRGFLLHNILPAVRPRHPLHHQQLQPHHHRRPPARGDAHRRQGPVQLRTPGPNKAYDPRAPRHDRRVL